MRRKKQLPSGGVFWFMFKERGFLLFFVSVVSVGIRIKNTFLNIMIQKRMRKEFGKAEVYQKRRDPDHFGDHL
jgi:hypothetical protein